MYYINRGSKYFVVNNNICCLLNNSVDMYLFKYIDM